MKKILLLIIITMSITTSAQQILSPEALWKLGRVSAIGISKDGKSIVYKVSTPSLEENKSNSKFYTIPVTGGNAVEIQENDTKDLVVDKNISPDGKYILSSQEVKTENVLGKDFYPELEKSEAQIYNGLDYRHWDTWNNGTHNHVFYAINKGSKATPIDIMKGEPYDSPQKPFGGDEDYIWSPNCKSIIYVCKKKFGTAYAISTNTDLYEYDIETKTTKNLTENNPGYDTNPTFSPSGDLTWLQMKRDGYEADKNDIIVRFKGMDINLTANWDGSVESFKWSPDGKKIYFIAAFDGTLQLFEIDLKNITVRAGIAANIKQLTNDDFDIRAIVDLSGDNIIVSRTDMNHADEIYSYNLKKKTWLQLTKTNDVIYSKLALPKFERRYVTTTDGKKMLVWVILPPNFDKTKKYPTLLYCQGGPQSPLTQFYSFRWNFSLMASQGYVVVAPNRRGMYGHGQAWNEQISKDWGGQVMDDYLSAIDDVSKESYVDKSRLGCIGASYGGYSVYYLAGIHNNRFKTFISHDGVFNTQSMFGTTEEVFFNNWDFGGPYWDKNNADAQKAYNQFNPINFVDKWNTPILIIQGGKDYRVCIGQAQEAFQAAQLRGIKSRFLYFPEENHWVLKPQNALAWQYEFYKWLNETL
jgi:dipeptidyl aminopeptidase/acylaminoacyl peptidase